MIEPGDLVFCHSSGMIGRGIRIAQWIAGDRCVYNHVAIVDRQAPGGDWYVIQAEAAGVTDDKLLSTITPGGYHEIVPPPEHVNPDDILDFARAQVGDPYGFLTDASIALTLVTPTFFNVMRPWSWICSALAAESLRYAGWLHNWPDAAQVTPAQLYVAL